MAIKTQGTHLYYIDPDTNEVARIGCVTSIDGIDSTNDEIEVTCLEDLARAYVAGLATPGTATFGINTDPSDASHVRIHQLKTAGTVLDFAVGWSESGDAPTVDSNNDFDLPDTRSWLVFDGYLSSFPFSFAQSSVVQSTVGIRITGEIVLVPKA